MLSKRKNTLVKLMPTRLPYQWCESKFTNEGLTKRKKNALLAVCLFIYVYHSGVANLVVVNGGDARGGSCEVLLSLLS